MAFPLSHNWWSLAARGALAVGFGMLTLAMPGLTLSTLVPFFGAFALLEGGFNLVAAYRSAREGEFWTAFSLEGGVGLGCGMLALAMPDMSLLGLIYLMALWAFLTGGLDIAADVRLRRRLPREWLLAVGGAASVGFALLLVVAPTAATVGRWMGAYALLLGAALLALAMRLRAFLSDHERATLRPSADGT